MAFSHDGKQLAAISMETNPQIAIFDVEKWKQG